ncbi:ABC transporter permease [Serinibacter arcticus]|uniref:Putative membrane protein n=1 Tax=Serinibacter arcticus TaxID=1655435 RepID=A0A4Z1DYR1_9MICO|nr:ABC transporter permease [Serinibacter arcticus]TGO04130.1 putative membrane protein [Serinibacter arcticus]
MTWWRLSRRALADQRGAVALVVLVITVLSLAVTALPRIEATARADQVRHRLADVSPQLRDLSAVTSADALSALDPSLPVTPEDNRRRWAAIAESFEATRTEVSPPLRDALGAGEVTATTDGYAIPLGPGSDVRLPTLSLAADQRIAERVEMVDGAPPAPVSWDPAAGGGGGAEELPDLEIEVMLLDASADRLGLATGDRITVGNLYHDLTLVLSGTYRVLDPDDGYWAHETNGAQPRVVEDLNLGTAVNGRAYVASDGWWSTLAALGQPAQVSLWYPVDVAAIRGGDPALLAAQLRGLTAQQVELTASGGGGGGGGGERSVSIGFASELAVRVDAVAGENAAASNIVALVVVGPLGVAVAVLALLTQLLLERRRPALAIVRARGASPARLRTVLGLEGLLLGLPAAAVGWGVATSLLGTSPGWRGWLPAVVLGVVPAVVLLSPPLPTGLRGRRRDLAVGGLARDVVVLAAAGLVLSQVLSVAPGAVAGTGDPLLVVAPLVLALAVTVLVLRLYPWLARAAHTVLRRGRSLTGFLGSARAVRDPGATLTSVLAVVVGVSVAVFSVVTLATLREGVERTVWVTSGSDLRISGPRIDAAQLEQVRSLDGVAAAATVATVSPAILSSPSASVRATLHLVDGAAYADVLADVPPSVGAAPVADLLGDGGGAGGAVPLMVSPRLDLAPGADGVRLSTGESVDVRVVASGNVLPGVADAGATWVLADAAALPDVAASTPARLLLVRLVPGADGDAVAEAVVGVVGPAGVENAAAAREAATGTPVLRLLTGTLAGSVVAAALLALGSLVAVQAAAAPRRARMLATLRLLGLRRSAQRSLAWWDLTPWVVLGATAAYGLGLVTSHLLLRTLDLRAFTGADQPQPVLPPVALAATAVGVLLAVVACSILPTIRRARTPTAQEDP